MTDLTRIDKPFGELDAETKGALLLAAHEGAEIEWYGTLGECWTLESDPQWTRDIIYRVKTIPDTLDWSQVANGWNWMARDKDGNVFLFRSEPYLRDPVWTVDGWDADPAPVTQSSYRRGTRHWSDSLIQRPEVEE